MAQEQRKYEKEYKVQAVKLAKEIGAVPDNLEVSFPPLWTPTAKEIAGIARDKAEIIMAAFQANLFDQSTALKELKKLEGETGMFSSISEEDIAAGKGRTIQDLTALRDPLAGLSFGSNFASDSDDSDFDSELETEDG